MESTVDDVSAWMGVSAPVRQNETRAPAENTEFEPAVYDRGLVAFVHVLQHPFTLNGTHYGAITVQHPTHGDFEDLRKGHMKNTRALLCKLSGVENAVIRALVWADSEVIHQKYCALLPEFVNAEEDPAWPE